MINYTESSQRSLTQEHTPTYRTLGLSNVILEQTQETFFGINEYYLITLRHFYFI